MSNKKPVFFLTFANDKVDDALYLRNLPLELHGIRDALQAAVKAGLCEVVERTAATIDQIFDIFQDPYYKDRIAVFHYGGHASGNQLMLETLDGGHGTSHSEGLVPFLGKQKGLKLVFINGCSSQQQSLEMIEAGIPAVVGTATAIKDTIATQLSTRFYNGLASGFTIDQTWQQSIDSIKTKVGTKKSKGLKLRRDKQSNFPWNMFIRQGSEIVKDWNLPMAVNNPLFGLPKLPEKFNLPEQPFRFLERYKEEHAEVFFGRGRYIRDLYNRASDKNASSVILLYGQSGVGKSSMLDAGVLPRLEQENQVIYLRRDHTLGLLGSLRQALGLDTKVVSNTPNQSEDTIDENSLETKLAPLTSILPALDDELKGEVENFIDRLMARQTLDEAFEEMDDRNDHSIIFQKWKAIEDTNGEPLLILLDQVEEVFTKENPEIPNELDDFFAEVSQIFSNPQIKPNGKLILSYRKEYHPEIEEICKNHQIPREQIFLKQLSKTDIEEVILGLTSTTRLSKRYELDVEDGLPAIIADDLLEDKDSPIAPVLQILLTKMWNMSVLNRGEDEEHHRFSIQNYQQLKKEGILMDDFFYQQMEKLEVWNKELVTSGLALDILNFHTTRLGTANAKHLDDIRARYEHQQGQIPQLIAKLKELYLLTDAGLHKTGLAHDTIAPLVQDSVRTSDHPGQRAFRILRNKIPTYEAFPETIIDADDLVLVEEGAGGMRLWTFKEKELIAASRAKRDKDKRRRRFFRRLAAYAVAIIIGLGIWSIYSADIAKKAADRADTEAGNALLAQQEALDSAAVAQDERINALKAEKEAVSSANKAIEERKKAELAQLEAEKQELIAKDKTQKAIEAKNDAIKAKEKEIAAAIKAAKSEAEARAAQIEALVQTRIAIEKKIQVERNYRRGQAILKADNAETLARLDKHVAAVDASIAAYSEILTINNEINKDGEKEAIPSEVYVSLNTVFEEVSNEKGHNIVWSHEHLAKDLEFNTKTGKLAFSTFSGRENGSVYVLKNDFKGKENRQILPISDEIRTLRFSPNGNLLIAGTVNGKIIGWIYNSSKEEYEKIELFDKKSYFTNQIVHSVSLVEAKGKGFYYLGLNTSNAYYIYQMTKTGRIVQLIQTETVETNYSKFSKSGQYFAYTTFNNVVLLKWSISQKKWRKMKTFAFGNVTEIGFSSDENLLAIGNTKGQVKLQNVISSKVLLNKTLHKSSITALKFNNTNSQLITSSLDNTVKLYDLVQLQEDIEKDPLNVKIDPFNLLGPSSWVWDVTFDNEQKYVYAISQDGTIRKWPTNIEELYKNLLELQIKLNEEEKKKDSN